MRARRGIFPTDSLVTGQASLDLFLESASARIRKVPSIRDEIVKHDVVVTGYPRSGNSFLAKTLKCASNQVSVGERQHSPLAVPLGATEAVPIVIPIREPIETISSWVLFRGASWSLASLRKYVRSYTRWYDFVRRNRDPEMSVVIPFNEFTGEPSNVLRRPLIRDVVQPENVDLSPEEILVELRQQEVAERGSSFATTASVPVGDRERALRQVQKRLGATALAEAINAANEQFELLRAEVEQLP